jgi:hypothetical protein
MTRAAVFSCLMLGLAVPAMAQPAPPAQAPARHLVGRSIQEHWQFDGRSRINTGTATLTFTAPDGGPTMTVEFVGRYRRELPQVVPAVVDLVVTQHLPDEDLPRMTLRVNGDTMPLIARPRSARAVVATMTFDQFERLTTAASLMEEAFNTELEFSAPQLRMLKSTADRWAGR